MPMPPLRRGQARQISQEPGAFSVEGINHQRMDQFRPVMLLDQEDTEAAPLHIKDTNAGLQVAKVVKSEEFNLPRAKEFDATNQQELEQKRKNTLGYCIATGITLFVAVIVLLLVFLLAGDHDPTATLQPTLAPTSAPTETPSTAPSAIVDTFSGCLPAFTLKSLEDPTSAQSQASGWLLQHPDISKMALSRKIQLFAMATLYFSLAGPRWPLSLQRSWLNYQVHECNWFSNTFGAFNEEGIFKEGIPEDIMFGNATICNETTCTLLDVTLFDLDLAGLSATLPPEISLLTALEYFWLQDCNAIGSLSDFLPSQFYEMNTLAGFLLQVNSLSGGIPSEFGLMTNLQAFEIGDNMLSGVIPSEFGEVTNLELMNLWDNHLTGTIPDTLTALTKMWYFVLEENNLSGTTPTWFGTYTNIEFAFYLGSNGFPGTLPSEFGLLASLEALSLGRNPLLTGTIPTELSLLSDLIWLELQELPLLSGSIPGEFELLKTNGNLTEFNFSASTGLTGVIPEDLCSLKAVFCSNCSLDFDCGWRLCGCDCLCSNTSTNTTNATVVAPAAARIDIFDP